MQLNHAFGGRPIYVPAAGKLRRLKLTGGMNLTILSPGVTQLQLLRKDWKKTMAAAAGDAQKALKKLATAGKYKDVLGPKRAIDVDALADVVTKSDASPANGSSIVVLAEFEGKRCLFAADSHADVLEASISRLLDGTGSRRLQLDAFKVPHHGSKYNNPTSLIQKLNCHTFLVSTNGKIFHHPDPETIARIIKYGGPNPRIYFNYASDRTKMWNDEPLKRRHKYEVIMRADTDPTLDIVL